MSAIRFLSSKVIHFCPILANVFVLQVKLDLMKQGNEYEVIEFLLNRMKLMTGIGKPKLNNVGPLVPTDPGETVGSED